VTLKWYGAERKADILRAVQDAIGAVAINFHETMKVLVSKPGRGRFYKRPTRTHQASAPGDPPTVDTGDYRRSIQVDMSHQRDARPVARVGTNSVKGPWLEFGRGTIEPRPHWIPTFKQERGKLLKIAQAVITKRMKAVK